MPFRATAAHRGISPAVWVLVVALLQGVLFLFLAPPWQHYDEPGHFEYAWLAANRPGWPRPGDVDAGMRREVAASMIEHDFYRRLPGVPNLLAVDQPVPIAISQLGDVPLYYFLASLPLRALRYTDITFQLYAARGVSLILYLLAIWAALGLMRDLVGPRHPLSWMVPAFLAVLPPFTDLMTAVNNDAAAVAFSMLFLWGGVRILQRGFNLRRLLWLAGAAALCLLSKATAFIALPLALLVVWLGLFRYRRARPLLIIPPLLVVIAVVALFSWKEASPAYFSGMVDGSVPRRVALHNAPAGSHAFALDVNAGTSAGFYQTLPAETTARLAGKTVTLGVWMWADQPVDIRFPVLRVGDATVKFHDSVHLEAQPQFFAYSAAFPEEPGVSWLQVPSLARKDPTSVYWTGWALAEGDFSAAAAPVFTARDARQGTWAGKPFSNAIRNATAEAAWPVFRPAVTHFFFKYGNLGSTSLWAALDLPGAGWYFRAAWQRMFITFWAYFAWASVPLMGRRFYWVFTVLSLAGLIGALLAAWYHRKRLPWAAITLLAAGLIGAVAATILRGAGSWYYRLYLPVARYVYPLVLPAVLGLVGGWYFLYTRAARENRILRRAGAMLFIAGLGAYDLLAVLTLLRYFYL